MIDKPDATTEFVFKQKGEELTLWYGDPDILPDGEAEYLMTIHCSLLNELAESIDKLKNKNS